MDKNIDTNKILQEALALLSKNEHSNAIELLKTIDEENLENSQKGLYYELLSKCHQRLSGFEAARPYYEKLASALKKDAESKNNPVYYKAYGDILSLLGCFVENEDEKKAKFSEAENVFNKSINLSLKPNDKSLVINNLAEVFTSFGNVQVLLKKYKEAFEAFDDALNESPEDQNAFYYRDLTVQLVTKSIESEALKTSKAQISECVERIQNLLRYQPPKIPKSEQKSEDLERFYYYTSLTIGRKILVENSPLQLSDAASVNDPSEGALIKKLLIDRNFKNEGLANVEILTGDSSENKPTFILCFTKKNDSLDMWRFYGKENGKEAAGCSIAYTLQSFSEGANCGEERLINRFSHVLYLTKEGRISTAQRNLKEKQFSPSKKIIENYWEDLKKGIKEFIEIDKKEVKKRLKLNELSDLPEDVQNALNKRIAQDLAGLLNPIRHLVKSDDYESEQELRLIVDYLPYEHPAITWDKNEVRPRAYLNVQLKNDAARGVTFGSCAAYSHALATIFKAAQTKQGNTNFFTQRSTLSFR